MPTVQLLEYVAGNVRSLANAIQKLGYTIEWIKDPKDIEHAEVCIHRLSTQRIADDICIVVDPTRRWPFWPLSRSALCKWLSRTNPYSHRIGETIHGNMCWFTSLI